MHYKKKHIPRVGLFLMIDFIYLFFWNLGKNLSITYSTVDLHAQHVSACNTLAVMEKK